MFVQAAKFEEGRVFFPRDALWLKVFLEEMLAFPEGGYSDQVDSVSQALNHEGKLLYTDEAIKGLNNFYTSLWLIQRRGW